MGASPIPRLDSMMTEFLTDEQIKKRAIISEDVDIRGLVKRHRVANQTIFDMMFLMELIGQSHHEAAHLFLHAFSISGAACRSLNLENEIHAAAHKVGNAIGEKRMAFSSAYRAMVDDVGEELAGDLVKYMRDVYSYPDDLDILRGVATFLKNPLNSLARHYGVEFRIDPRKVMRRQMRYKKK